MTLVVAVDAKLGTNSDICKDFMKYFIDFALFCHDFLVFLAKKLAGMETFRIFAARIGTSDYTLLSATDHRHRPLP